MGLITDYYTARLYFVSFDCPNLLWWDGTNLLPNLCRPGKMPNALHCLLPDAVHNRCVNLVQLVVSLQLKYI